MKNKRNWPRTYYQGFMFCSIIFLSLFLFQYVRLPFLVVDHIIVHLVFRLFSEICFSCFFSPFFSLAFL